MKPRLFSESDLRTFRDALKGLRDPRAYAPGKWSVSGLNRRADVVRGRFPEKVVLRDITLRSMEQLPGVVLGSEERLSFIRQLAAAGVPEITSSGFVRARTPEEHRAEVAAAREANPGCSLVYLEPVVEEDFRLAAAAGYDCVQLLSVYLGAATPVIVPHTYHRLLHDRDWHTLRFPKTPGEQIARSVKRVAIAKQHGLKVSAGINLVAYQTESYLADYAAAVAEAGADEVMLLDSSGGLGPEAYAHVVSIARAAASGRARIGVHAHDTFGLGLAGSLAAAREGAEVIEVAINGYVLGPPQADLAAAAAALEAVYGVGTGIDLGRLVSLSRTAEALTGIPIAPNYPVVGREFFALGEPDAFVEDVDVDPLLHKPLAPELVGNLRPVLITAGTGVYGMWRKLDQLGIDVARKDDVRRILAGCLEFMMREKRQIADHEIRNVAAALLPPAANASRTA